MSDLWLRRLWLEYSLLAVVPAVVLSFFFFINIYKWTKPQLESDESAQEWASAAAGFLHKNLHIMPVS